MSPFKILLRAWPVIAVVDFVYASSQALYNGRTVSGLWRGVASTALGPEMREAGALGVAAGIGVHITVALAWSAVFVGLATQVAWVRRSIASPFGILLASFVYGPFVWLVMSQLVIPAATGNPGTLTSRWFIGAAGHVFFVALPIIWVVSRAQRSGSAARA